MKLVVGLGNPGREYSGSRHNIGFGCLNRLARAHHIQLTQSSGRAKFGIGKVDGVEVLLARPATYMNLSGEAVKNLMKRYRIPVSDLIVVHDDLDLPLGRIRIRQDGSSGGHKGIESIIASTDSRDFVRVRLGIGRPEGPVGEEERRPEEIAGFVLSEFLPEETDVVKTMYDRAAEAVRCILTEGPMVAMNKYNQNAKPQALNPES